MKLPPAGTILTPRGRHLHDTRSMLGSTYPASLGSLRSALRKCCPSACFRKGSRGGTWNVPRDTWRHVTHTIVVPALWRIEWAWSRPDPTNRSAAIDESAPPALPLRPARTESVVAPPVAKFVPNVTHWDKNSLNLAPLVSTLFLSALVLKAWVTGDGSSARKISNWWPCVAFHLILLAAPPLSGERGLVATNEQMLTSKLKCWAPHH